MVQAVGSAKVQVRTLLADVLHVQQHAPGELMLDAEAPRLQVRRADHGADGANGVVAHIVQQAQCVAWRLVQAVRVGIAEMQIRRGAVVVVGGQHAGVLVKALAGIAAEAVGAGTRLREVDAVTATRNPARPELIGKAKARLQVVPVNVIGAALAGAGEDLAAVQLPHARRGDGRLCLGIEPVQAVVAFRARHR